jgi:hypothetical protein
MPEAIAPPQMDLDNQPVNVINPVAPPTVAAAPKTAPPVSDAGQIQVTALKDAFENGDNKKVADLIVQKNKADEEGHINTHMQVPGMLASALKGDWMGVWKYYNGGPTKFEEGVTPTGEKVYKQYNANGFTGEMASGKNFKPLSQRERADIELNKGGVITARDRTALEGSAFTAIRSVDLAAKTGLALPVVDAMKKSYETSQVASQTNNKISQNIDRLKNHPILDVISKLTPEQRKDVFGFTQSMGTTAKGETTAERNAKNTSGTEQKTGNVNLGGGGSVGRKGGPNANGEVSGGASDTKSATSSENNAAEAGTTSSNARQNIETMITKIQKYTQGAIKKPEELDAVRAFLQDQATINQVNASIAPENRAPGVVSVPPIEMGMQSRKDAILNSYDMQRNNALDSAYAAFVAHKVRSGDLGDREANREEFMQSKTFQGIKYKYDSLKKAIESGKDHVPKEGDIDVGPNNRPRVYRDGNWEQLNGR